MNLNKSSEFFKPSMIGARVHVVGCGSVGSTLAENLARCGVTKFGFWDFDKVEAHNIVNQMFTDPQIGKLKVEALKEIILSINPDAEPDIELHPEGWQGELLTGYVFLAVDSIEIRREFVEKHMDSPYVKAVFDIRTLLESTGRFDVRITEEFKGATPETVSGYDLIQFSHEEAKEETPVSACGTTLGVATTVRLISAYAVNNFINFVKGRGLKTAVLMDGFNFVLDAFPVA